MNGQDLARKLRTNGLMVRRLIESGEVKAAKKKGRWDVDEASFKAFQRRNRAKLDRLREEYIALYWEGLTVQRLQARTKEDFKERGIFYPAMDFAEKTIYEAVKKPAHSGTGK